jgi:hypothetical protein
MSVHVRTPGELIASIPVLLGFVPLDSIVVVGISASGRVAPVVRLDRDDCLIAELAQSVATAVAGHLARARATSVVLVCFRQGGGPLQCAALDVLRSLLSRHIEVADAWVVANGRFRAPECPDPGCCPDRGKAVPAAPVDMPSYGRSQGGSSHGGPDDLRQTRAHRAPGDRRKSARAAFKRAWRARATAQAVRGGERDLAGGSVDPLEPERRAALARWRLEKLNGWRDALAQAAAGIMPSDAETGKLAAGLSDIVVRDAAVISMVPGRREVANALCEDPATPGVREALSVMIAAEAAVQPREADVLALVTLAEHVASLCDEAIAPALTLAGLALWWSGDDSTADYVIACALAAQPGYRLAELVACALDAHMPPGWITAA